MEWTVIRSDDKEVTLEIKSNGVCIIVPLALKEALRIANRLISQATREKVPV